jgi:hypothetical protein
MSIKLVTATAACLVTLAGCSFSHMQAPTQAASTPWVSKPNVGTTIGSNGPVVGVNLYALHNYTAAQTETDGKRMLSYIKNVLHASAVDIVWNMYAPSYHSNSVVTTADTLSAANVGILTRIARGEHLLVEYRPLMFVLTRHNSWEGLIRPSDPTQWFNSYYRQNLPYLRLAQKYRIDEYVIGTEMDRLSPDQQWAGFLARCAGVYHGQITYAAHQWLYFPPRTQLPPTALTGMDMYERLKLPASAPLSKVVAAYEHYFISVPDGLLRRTAIQETGIEARAGAYAFPPNLRLTGVLNEAVQYNWFIAACETMKRFHMRAVFFFKVDLSDFPIMHPASSLSTFEGKQGAVAISKCASIIRG